MKQGSGRGVAFLWDQSGMWGLMAWRSPTAMGMDVSLVTAGQVRQGELERHRILFVPGGWAADKLAALGSEGARAARDFVMNGGAYLGGCGGAGMGWRRWAGVRGCPTFQDRSRLYGKAIPGWTGRRRAWWRPPGGRGISTSGTPEQSGYWPNMGHQSGGSWCRTFRWRICGKPEATRPGSRFMG